MEQPHRGGPVMDKVSIVSYDRRMSPNERYLQFAEDYNELFHRLFGQPLGRFVDSGGFDIVTLEKALGLKSLEDEVSVKDCIEEGWGEDGVALITTLLEGPTDNPGSIPTKCKILESSDLQGLKVGKFRACTYKFPAIKAGYMLYGEGEYHKGLIVHVRNHDYDGFTGEFSTEETPDGEVVKVVLTQRENKRLNWTVSTRQGVLVFGGIRTRGEAKLAATAMAMAIDFEEANSLALTDDQKIAANTALSVIMEDILKGKPC